MDDPGFVLDPEARTKLAEMLAWPKEEGGSVAEEISDRRVRQAAASIGFNVEEQMAAMMEARRRAAAERTTEGDGP